MWTFSHEEAAFMKDKTRELLEMYVSGCSMTFSQIVSWINH
jgi:hypothetical protein